VQFASSLEHDHFPGVDLALEGALARPGCPICRVLREAEDRLLHGGAATSVYCERHLSGLIERKDVLTGANAAPVALDRVTAGTSDAAACRVCSELAAIAERALVVLCERIDAGGGPRERYARSDGLCVYHLRAALALDAPAAGALRDDRRARLERLRRQLCALIESFDAGGGRLLAADAGGWLAAERALRRAPSQLAVRPRQAA
jgi:hypothetical protein